MKKPSGKIDLIIDWEEYVALVQRLYKAINWKGIKEIIGINRGGLIIAVMLSHLHNDIVVSEYTPGEEYVLAKGRKTKECLLVDDIADSGGTFLKAIHNYSHDIKTASIFCAERNTQFIPDWYVRATTKIDWILFPYEKGDIDANEIESKKSKKRRKAKKSSKKN